jgi:hypothetical protein
MQTIRDNFRTIFIPFFAIKAIYSLECIVLNKKSTVLYLLMNKYIWYYAIFYLIMYLVYAFNTYGNEHLFYFI